MFNSSVLDVAIGIVFVYLMFGLMCTTVNEWIAQMFKTRGQTLKEGIRRLLNAPPDGTYMIRPVDLNAAAALKRLGDPNDRLTKALGDVTDIKADSTAAAVQQALAKKLNTLLQQPGLADKVDTSAVTPETLAEAQGQLQGNDLLRVNYKLLHEAYPDVIIGLSEAFYSHPLIKSLAKPGEHPSYVPARTFAAVLLDIFSKGQQSEAAFANVQTFIGDLPDSDVKRSLQALLKSTGGKIETFQAGLEKWFDDAMDRVSGWYKKRTQVWTIIVASLITIFANADTIQIARKLYLSPTLREKIVQEAGAAAKGPRPAESVNVEYQDNTPIPTAPVIGAPQNPDAGSAALSSQELAQLGELTGWTEEWKIFHRIEGKPATDGTFPGTDLVTKPNVLLLWVWEIAPGHLLGWLLTAIAVSLGAPFWFDTLNKFMNIRSSGTAPNEKGNDKSKA